MLPQFLSFCRIWSSHNILWSDTRIRRCLSHVGVKKGSVDPSGASAGSAANGAEELIAVLQSPGALRSDHLVMSQRPSLRQLPGLSRVWRSRNTCWSNAKLPLARGEKSGPFDPLGASAGPAAYGASSTHHGAASRATISKSTSPRGPLGYFLTALAQAPPCPQQSQAQLQHFLEKR